MEAQENEGKSLIYVTVHPDGYNPLREYPLIILLHGFGASMYDLAQLAPALGQTGYVYACPNAPIPFDLGGGNLGFGWTPPTAFGDPNAMRQSEQLLDIFIDEVVQDYRVAPKRALLLGFSQGGTMAYRCGLSRPDTFAGVAALSTGLSDPDSLAPRLPLQRSQSVFVAHGEADPVVAVDAARQSRKLLETWGYQPEYHEYNMGHEITMEEVQDLVPWIQKVLPPLGGGLILP